MLQYIGTISRAMLSLDVQPIQLHISMVSPGQRPPIRNLPPQKSSLFEFSNPDAHLYKLGAKRTPSGNKSNQTLGGRCNVIYRKVKKIKGVIEEDKEKE